MGWTCLRDFHDNNKDFIESEIGSHCNDKYAFESHSIRGNTAYSLGVNKTDPNDCFVMVTLIRREDGEICYKTMQDSCVPYEFDCPEKYLKRCTNPSSQEYVRLCREHQAKKKALKALINSLSYGDKIVFENGKELYFKSKLVTGNYSKSRVSETYFVASRDDMDGQNYKWKNTTLLEPHKIIPRQPR